ncbi:transmembrane domain-containing protein [Streptomyces sp. NPDC093085]|uniref:transmembrane domain-containing protein n=1 Tax=Streptomyces sp. NPDC093085 TaxID=3155068 RepID=UPI0034481C21
MIPRRLPKALARTAGVLGLTVAVLAATIAPVVADPQPMGRCTTSAGVVLAVDFSHWGGPIYRSCGTTPTTGYELLNQGGWRTTGTGHDGPAFICRIGYSGFQSGKPYPTAAEEDCVLTPPASAYWSYWHADPGAEDWSYSQLGAMLYKPKPGSVDLWIFGGTDIGGTEGRPKVTPAQLRAHNTRPQGDTGKPAATDKAPVLPPDTDTGPAPERQAGEPPETVLPEPTKTKPSMPYPPSPTTSPTSSPSPTPSPPSSAASTPPAVAAPRSGPSVVDAAPAADAGHDSGSIAPVVTGAALVVVIGGAAVFVARRRRAE